MYQLLFSPTFEAEFENVLKAYPHSFNRVKNEILALRMRPTDGDAYPGFSPFQIRKLRLGLKAYNIGKSKGLRFIYLLIGERQCLIPIHIYKKGEYKKEYDVVQRIKANLKKILSEQASGLCTQHWE